MPVLQLDGTVPILGMVEAIQAVQVPYPCTCIRSDWCWVQVYAELTPRPIAAASLGQVYKGKLRSGETVAVKVQRPYVLETVSIDLFVIR